MSCSKLNGLWRYRKRVRLLSGRRIRIFGTPDRYGLSNTKVGAEEAERRHVNEVMGPKQGGPSPLFSEFTPIYIDHSEAKNEYSSVKAKRQILRDHLGPAFDAHRLDEITFDRIEDVKNKLVQPRPKGAGLSNKTANNVLTVLRRLLVLANKRGVLAHVPEIEWLPTTPGKFDFLTFEESEDLIEAAELAFRAMIVVGLRCGLRQGELLALRWEDVDLKNGRITVRRSIVRAREKGTKSRRIREIPLGQDVALELARHRHLRGPFVFCDDAGNRLTNGECKWPLYNACTGAQLRRIGWHVLRHTFGSQLAMQGAAPSTIQKLMGHSTLRMTERYMHLSPNISRDAVKLLDRAAHPTCAQSVPGTARKRGTGRDQAG
jgi:integrase